MQVVCEATQSESSEVQVAAFQCLVRIMQTYYDKMRLYMEKALFGVRIYINISILREYLIEFNLLYDISSLFLA